MNTPRTALEECLRLAELATPGEWFVVGNTGDAAIISTSSDPNDESAHIVSSSEWTYLTAENAAAIVAAINLLRTHGKALSDALEYLDGWLPIKSIPKDGSRVELLSANGKTDYGYWYSMAVPSADVQDHLSTESGEGNYTHWRPIPAHGQEVDDEM